MREQSIRDYMAFGQTFRSLQQVHRDDAIKKKSYLEDLLKDCCNVLEEFGLIVSLRVARKLMNKYEEISKNTDGTVISQENASRLKPHVDNLFATLDAELEGQIVYVTTEKRYDIKKLLKNMSLSYGTQSF